MSQVEDRPANQTTVQPEPRKQAIAKLAAPRLPYHPVALDQFGIDRATWRALVESLYPMAKTTEAVLLALAYCKARHLDIMKKPVHIVPMWNSELNREVETVWPAITEHRITAHRTREYAGTDPTRFGPDVTQKFEAKIKKGKRAGQIISAEVTFPEWAEVTVYRMVEGVKCAFPGPRIKWLEYFGMNMGLPVPNARWARAPLQMLEKCAEAAALRKAFTEELGGEPVAEEMEGRIIQQVLTQLYQKRPEAKAGAGADFTAENEVIDVAAHVVTAPAEDEEEIAEEEVGEQQEESGVQETARPDRVAEYVAARIEDAKKADAKVLAELDQNIREAIVTEERPELLAQWEAAHKARVAELDHFPGDPKPEEAKKPAAKASSDPAYDGWLAEQYQNLASARMTRTVDDLQDTVLPDLKEADRGAWNQACNAKAKELLTQKGGKK